jgi:hypothetical protein
VASKAPLRPSDGNPIHKRQGAGGTVSNYKHPGPAALPRGAGDGLGEAATEADEPGTVSGSLVVVHDLAYLAEADAESISKLLLSEATSSASASRSKPFSIQTPDLFHLIHRDPEGGAALGVAVCCVSCCITGEEVSDLAARWVVAVVAHHRWQEAVRTQESPLVSAQCAPASHDPDVPVLVGSARCYETWKS